MLLRIVPWFLAAHCAPLSNPVRGGLENGAVKVSLLGRMVRFGRRRVAETMDEAFDRVDEGGTATNVVRKSRRVVGYRHSGHKEDAICEGIAKSQREVLRGEFQEGSSPV